MSSWSIVGMELPVNNNKQTDVLFLMDVSLWGIFTDFSPEKKCEVCRTHHILFHLQLAYLGWLVSMVTSHASVLIRKCHESFWRICRSLFPPTFLYLLSHLSLVQILWPWRSTLVIDRYLSVTHRTSDDVSSSSSSVCFRWQTPWCVVVHGDLRVKSLETVLMLTSALWPLFLLWGHDAGTGSDAVLIG